MRREDYRDYVHDIIDSINETDEFVKGMTLEDFLKDKKTINTVIRSIEVIGEAAKNNPFYVKMMRSLGNKRKEIGDGKPKLDKYGHFIVDHDLHNHNSELTDGIAEAFIDWAKKERLSFWRNLNGKRDNAYNKSSGF